MGNCYTNRDFKTESPQMRLEPVFLTNEWDKRRQLRVDCTSSPVPSFISDELAMRPMKKARSAEEAYVPQRVTGTPLPTECPSFHTSHSCNLPLHRKGSLSRPLAIDEESFVYEAALAASVKTKKSSTGRNVLPAIFLGDLFSTAPGAGDSPSLLMFSTSVFSQKSSSCQSKNEYRTTCPNLDQENESRTSFYNDSYGEFILPPSKGFDGLDKRSINRYDIGLDILKAEVANGACPKRMSTHGARSCLMFAVLAEDFHFVKELVETHEVNVNQTNAAGETALGFAIELGRDDIANYLRIKGALVAANEDI